MLGFLVAYLVRTRFAPAPEPPSINLLPASAHTPVLTTAPAVSTPSASPSPTPLLIPTRSTSLTYFVAPDGTPQGDGSQSKPWDLQTALNQPSAVLPGDTIRLLSGQYTGSFTSHLKGAPGHPIIVRQAAGARATLNGPGPILTIADSQWTYFWGFEITQPNPIRTRDPKPNQETGILIHSIAQSNNIKFINLVIHDMPGTGLSWWKTNSDSELYGSLLYYDGSTTLDHGIYTQNQVGNKKITDNFIFDNASHGIHVFGSKSAFLDNYVITGNTVFDNGTIGFNPANQSVGNLMRNILVGGNSMAHNPVVVSNYTYYPANGGIAFTLGYNAGSENAVVENNYFVKGRVILSGLNQGLILTGNTILNRAIQGLTRYTSPDNSWLNTDPDQNVIFVRPNRYEPGRANLTIYNWSRLSEVTVPAADLSQIELKTGDHYELHNVQDFYGDVIQGVYDGSGIIIPMEGRTVAQPAGLNFKPPSTFPEFGAFLLITLK
ncbi:MAG TPA: right-handed parallel beta-helix repeat-containing protein [Anaerolineaceae bacterium]|nr:right-handed parallel beta-helix repeat-containing protein [Anaerolineaceae bacterium]